MGESQGSAWPGVTVMAALCTPQVLRSRGGQEGEDEQTRPDFWGQAAHASGGACTGENQWAL